MFIGMYKSVNSPKEFLSEQRNTLDFPTQITRNSERFMLHKTMQVSSKTHLSKIFESAKNNGIEYDIKVD